MRILTVRQPWAWLIIHCGKDVENRSWAPKYRGPLLILAGAYRPSEAEIAAIENQCGVTIPRNELLYGGIIGCVELIDCARHSESRWWMGPPNIAWELRNPQPLPLIPWRGTLHLAPAPDALTQAVIELLRLL